MQTIVTDAIPDQPNWLQNEAVYNGRDAAVTLEIDPKLERQMDHHAKLIYDFERALQKPALHMMLRGIRIDQDTRASMMARFEVRRDRLERWLSSLALAIWHKELNPNSPAQLKEIFYEYM